MNLGERRLDWRPRARTLAAFREVWRALQHVPSAQPIRVVSLGCAAANCITIFLSLVGAGQVHPSPASPGNLLVWHVRDLGLVSLPRGREGEPWALRAPRSCCLWDHRGARSRLTPAGATWLSLFAEKLASRVIVMALLLGRKKKPQRSSQGKRNKGSVRACACVHTCVRTRVYPCVCV